MKDDPDELLKTKGKIESQNIDPDACLKTKGLGDNFGEADSLLKSKRVSTNSVR